MRNWYYIYEIQDFSFQTKITRIQRFYVQIIFEQNDINNSQIYQIADAGIRKYIWCNRHEHQNIVCDIILHMELLHRLIYNYQCFNYVCVIYAYIIRIGFVDMSLNSRNFIKVFILVYIISSWIFIAWNKSYSRWIKDIFRIKSWIENYDCLNILLTFSNILHVFIATIQIYLINCFSLLVFIEFTQMFI